MLVTRSFDCDRERHGRGWLVGVALLLLNFACASDAGMRVARAEKVEATAALCEVPGPPRILLDGGQGLLHVLDSAPAEPWSMVQGDLQAALARMLPQLHRPLRPLLPQRLQLSWSAPLSEEQKAALRREYLEWCSARSETTTCVSRAYLQELYLDEEDRVLMALDAAVGSVWQGVDPVVQQFLDPVAFKTSMLISLSTYLGLLLLPEPISKGVALTLGLVMLAALGADTAVQVRDAWREMRAGALSARSFAELRAVGERFGIIIGAQVTRLLILLATGALGNTTNLFLRGPGLPVLARTFASFEARTGVSLARVVETAQAMRIDAVGFTVSLAPPALFMSTRGTQAAQEQRSTASQPQASTSAPNKYRLREQDIEEWRKPKLTEDGKILPYPGTRNPPEPITNLGRNRAGQTITNGSYTIRFDKNGFVEFEPKFDTLIDKSHIGSGDRFAHFRAANQKLFEAIRKDPSLAQQLRLSPKDVEALPSLRKPPEGYSWHHHQHVGRMQLVEQGEHRLSMCHTGGMSIWGGGH